MAGFSGKTAGVDPMAYDFTDWLPEPIPEIGYTPGEHPIAEPATHEIVAYLGAYADLMRHWGTDIDRIQRRMTEASMRGAPGYTGEDKLSADELTAEIDRLEDEYAEYMSKNEGPLVDKRRELLSNVCGHNPSVALLERLPGRILDAFETYIQEQISGKARRTDTSS